MRPAETLVLARDAGAVLLRPNDASVSLNYADFEMRNQIGVQVKSTAVHNAMADMVGGHAGTVIRKSGEKMEQIVAATLKKLGK